MADEDALIGIGADLTQLRRDLARLPNLSAEAAQKTLIEVERVTLRAEKAAKQANRRIRADNKKTADSIKHIGETAGDADTALGGIASTLGLISPEAESATRAVQDLFAGVEGVARSKSVLGTVGVSVASLGTAAAIATPLIIAGGLAWKHYSDKAEDAKAKSEALRAQLDQLRDATAQLDDAVSDMELKTLVATGRFDEQSISAARNVELVMERAEAMKAAARGTDTFAIVEQHANEQVERAINLALYEEQESRKLAKAKEAEEAARSANAAALQREAEQAAELARVEAGQAQAASIVQQATEARLTGLDAIEAEQNRTMAALLATEQATQEQIDAVNREFHERKLEYIDAEEQAAITAAEARYQKEKDIRDAAREKDKKDREEAAEELAAYYSKLGSSLSGLFGDAADIFKSYAEKMAEDGKSGSKELFAAYKATAIAQAVINGALAISTIWRDFSGYPPVAAALSVASAAVSAAQIATIAAEEPSFHGGTSRVQAAMNRAPDETSAILRQDEAVLNSVAAARMGRSTISALNAGGFMSGGGTVAAVEFRNRTSSAMLADQQRRQGTPIKQHRRRGRGYGY